MWDSRHLTTPWASTACYGDSFFSTSCTDTDYGCYELNISRSRQVCNSQRVKTRESLLHVAQPFLSGRHRADLH
jgi:hypothetical protein